MKYNFTTIFLLAFAPVLFVSCGNLSNEVESKLDELKRKTDGLDSILNKEVSKVSTLDSLINVENERLKSLDSLINESAAKLDSVAKGAMK